MVDNQKYGRLVSAGTLEKTCLSLLLMRYPEEKYSLHSLSPETLN